MNKGIFPSEALLKKFDLESEYSDIVKSCISGDMGGLERALQLNQDKFIQSGVFITVERLRMVTLRNFVRRIANAVKEEPTLQSAPGKPNQIKLNLIYLPLQSTWDTELDLDELEFLLANLIANSLIKGYISHDSRILVLSNDAFPDVL